MRSRIASTYCLILLVLGFFLPATMPVYALSPKPGHQRHALADFPTVDPNYIYDQLFYMATNFQHREAGYDNNLPANINGHDEFASYWSQEMVKNLAGFGPQVRIDKFPVQGWQNRPAIVPAFNVEVSVPGVTHPEQVVVIGCHYDGMAISTQSANDDASGCAIELGVARAMGEYWRSHHTYPARTLRFVIFDAEEQGLYGSFHYVNDTINGDTNNVVAMFNEEQNGIAYPLRYLGKLVNPLLPFYVYVSPLKKNELYPQQDRLSQQQQANITRFHTLLLQAVTPVFAQFQALGFQSLIYHGTSQQDVSQPVFTPDQVNNVQLQDDTLGSSDQEPFTLAGLPCATFVGNSTYYDNNPPLWSYPYDQKEDTIQLMNTFASGSSRKSQALVLALGLPGMLTTWMLNQPDILGARGYPGNERSDLYALGVILYEMVTGSRPFRGDTPLAILTQHREATPTSPVLLNPNIPPALTMVIMTALAKDPNARFARATTMTAAIAEALNLPIPESLGPAAYPPDVRSMPTHISSPAYQIGAGMSPSSTPTFATSSPSMSPASGGSFPPGVATPSRSGPALPGNATPISWQPYSASASGGTVVEGSPPGSSSLPAGAIQSPVAPTTPRAPSSPIPLAPPSGRRWKRLYTVLAILIVLALLGSGLGAYFLFFHNNNQAAAPVPGGQAFFLSSGQLDFTSAQGVADELQIQLHNIPDPQSGKSYYAWLLGDRHPQTETNPFQPPAPFTLPFLLGKLAVSQGNVTFNYQAPHNFNLISIVSRLLITEEDTNGTPRGPAADRSAWRYYAEIPQTPYGSLHLSALDHIRHLFYKETVVNVLGLPGGLDTWLFRNTEKVMEWATSTRDDYHTQFTDSDFGVIHPLFVSILDYLDGSPNVHIDTPDGIAADPTISQVALLSVTPAQTQGTELANNPPGYMDHVQLHVKGIVDAPDATQQMRSLGNQIIQALNNNAKPWLEQVRMYAQQLVKMDKVQLAQPSALTMLDQMLLYATFAYIGKLDPKTNQVVQGVLQAHYLMQQLATLTITPQLPATI